LFSKSQYSSSYTKNDNDKNSLPPFTNSRDEKPRKTFLKRKSDIAPITIDASRNSNKLKGVPPDTDDVESLEKSVLAKYGSNAVKMKFLSNEEDSKAIDKHVKKSKFSHFTGFTGAGKSSHSNIAKVDKSYEFYDDYSDDESDSADDRPRKSHTALEKPLFRLRKPTEEKSLALEAELDIIRGVTKPNASLKKVNRTALAESDKNAYQKFEFGNLLANSDFTEQTQIFTNTSFAALGIMDVQILQNLDRMQLFNPTKIQSIALPIMMSKDKDRVEVVMQAQTGKQHPYSICNQYYCI